MKNLNAYVRRLTTKQGNRADTYHCGVPIWLFHPGVDIIIQ